MLKEWLNKRGEANLIAIVLIIGVTIAVGILVFLFLKKEVIANVEKAQCAAMEEINIDFLGECTKDDVAGAINIKLTNNGQQTIDGIVVIAYQTGGGGSAYPPSLIDCETGEECTVSYDGLADEVEILPSVVLKAGEENKLTVCEDKLIRVTCV